jgi:putative YphP/YqiW family bacilliredoxin
MHSHAAEAVQYMRDELTDVGFEELRDTAAVNGRFEGMTGTALLVVNSVCGCAARNARPGVTAALESPGKRPDRLLTVFAGVEREATEAARRFITDYPPSSPSVFLFKDGKVVFAIERRDIEGREADDIGQDLRVALEQFC